MRLFYHTCSISRQASTGEGISKTLQPLYTAVSCLILPTDPQTSLNNGWDYGQGYDAFFDTSQDVKKGDVILWNNTKLVVQGIKDYTGLPYVSHKEALCLREEQ
jgi:hypothetical protein